jgi:pimeloyl-ACP methyl ester carboxylesterase
MDGPADPLSGRHLAEAVMEQGKGAKVVILSDGIGHWPQMEAPREDHDGFFGLSQGALKTFGVSHIF